MSKWQPKAGETACMVREGWGGGPDTVVKVKVSSVNATHVWVKVPYDVSRSQPREAPMTFGVKSLKRAGQNARLYPAHLREWTPFDDLAVELELEKSKLFSLFSTIYYSRVERFRDAQLDEIRKAISGLEGLGQNAREQRALSSKKE